MHHFSKYLVPVLVGLGLLSGFFRELVLAYFFGTSRDIEIFRVAYGLPAIWGDSIAISFMSVLTPYILSAEAKDRNPFELSYVFWSTLIIASIITLIGILSMPFQARIFAPGIQGSEQNLLIWCGRVCWLMFFLSVCSIPFRATMSLKKRLWPAASAQLIKSFVLTICLVFLIVVLKITDIRAPVYAAVCGSIAMLAMHLLAIGRPILKNIITGFKTLPDWMLIHPILSALIIVFITQIFMSGGRILDRSFASTMEIGTLASIEYSYAVLMAMVGFLGATTNIILTPRIGKDVQATGRIPSKYFRIIFSIGICATFLGLLLSPLSHLIIKFIFHRGVFDEQSLKLTSYIFKMHALALGPLVVVVILNQLFLLQKKQTHLLWICLLKVVLRLSLILLFLQFFTDVRALIYALIISETTIAFIQIFFLNRLQNQY